MTELEILRQELARTKAELHEYKVAFDGTPHERTQVAFQQKLRLAPALAWVMATLYESKGRLISTELLASEMPGYDNRDDRDPQIVGVRICQLRKLFGFDAIQNVWGRGYRLSDTGRAICDAALTREAA